MKQTALSEGVRRKGKRASASDITAQTADMPTEIDRALPIAAEIAGRPIAESALLRSMPETGALTGRSRSPRPGALPADRAPASSVVRRPVTRTERKTSADGRLEDGGHVAMVRSRSSVVIVGWTVKASALAPTAAATEGRRRADPGVAEGLFPIDLGRPAGGARDAGGGDLTEGRDRATSHLEVP